jgi:tetratricopeptide (TPR) repeat protein
MQQADFYKWIENPAPSDRNRLEKLKKLIEKYPYFQAGWMLYLKSLKEASDPDYGTALKKAALLIPDRKQLYRYLHPKTEAYSNNIYFNQTGENPAGQDEEQHLDKSATGILIEKFLSTSPGAIKMEKMNHEKREEEGENEIVSKSSKENDEMITETLANIYVKQKKYDKALEAFKKLCLKYPKKNIYFANRMKEIEKLINI